ncbi:hypothetical protein L1887_51314 [Cichorium endivia]|nr:hypothetical protein L1887_51314 [Cichorium endivia]
MVSSMRMTGRPDWTSTPQSCSHWVPLAAHEIEAPTSTSKPLRSYTVHLWPARRRAMAAEKPPMPPPRMATLSCLNVDDSDMMALGADEEEDEYDDPATDGQGPRQHTVGRLHAPARGEECHTHRTPHTAHRTPHTAHGSGGSLGFARPMHPCVPRCSSQQPPVQRQGSHGGRVARHPRGGCGAADSLRESRPPRQLIGWRFFLDSGEH